jgi:hypothetical protein
MGRGGLCRTPVAAAILVALLAALPAGASDHRKPRVVLFTTGERRVGHPWTYTWVRPSNGSCLVIHADGVPDLDNAGAPWRPTRAIHVRLWKRQKPGRVTVAAYRKLSSYGAPAGRARTLAYRLRKRVWSTGRRIWVVRFRGPDVPHLYFELTARWRDTQGCGGTEELSAAWHLRRRA